MSDFNAFFRCLRDLSAPLPPARSDEPARRLLIDHALGQIARGLACQGLDALLFKGAALVQTIYARGAVRPMSDIDMLARRGESARIVGALQAIGAQFQHPAGRSKSAALLGENGLLLPQGSLGTWIEVHAHIGKAVPRPIDLDACFQRSRPLPAHPSLYIPSAEDHVLLIAVDASQNEFRYPQACLDIEMLFRSGLDFASLLERARRFQAETALYAALEILYFLGAASIRRDYIEALRPSWPRRAALSLLFRSQQPGLFPRARGSFRLGLVWMLRQALLRDDQIAYIQGVLRYARARMSERLPAGTQSP